MIGTVKCFGAIKIAYFLSKKKQRLVKYITFIECSYLIVLFTQSLIDKKHRQQLLAKSKPQRLVKVLTFVMVIRFLVLFLLSFVLVSPFNRFVCSFPNGPP